MELGEPEIIFVRSGQPTSHTQARLDTGEVSRTLEWFREVLLVVAKDGVITVKELKNLVKGNKVRLILYSHNYAYTRYAGFALHSKIR